MAHDLVISYSRKNREIADRLVELLRKRGFDVWYDRMIKPGSDWRDEIANAISHSRMFLILFSAESNASDELKKELAIADRRDLLILPVRIEEVEPAGHFEYELSRRQWFDIFDDWRARLPSVVDYIAETLVPEAKNDPNPPQPKPVLDPTPRPQPKPKPQRTPLPLQVESLALIKRDRRLALPLISLALGLCAFLILAIGFFDLFPGAIIVAILVPIWWLLQIFIVREAARGRSFGRLANWLTRIAAAVAVLSSTIMIVTDGNELEFPVLSGALMGLVFVGAACLALFNGTVRGRRGDLFWILPMIAASLPCFAWTPFEGKQLLPGAGSMAALGMVIAGTVYLIDLRRARQPEASSGAEAVATLAELKPVRIQEQQ